MAQITARLPDELVVALDGAASQLRRSRADVVRQAIEYYLDDFEDVAAAIAAGAPGAPCSGAPPGVERAVSSARFTRPRVQHMF